jgi:phage shock protein PspC (stress-responsive transcriptional regulator)
VRKVITVSLNGNAFQLEDDAYAALATYLEEAARALASNPDRAEIISDLEQAIADKCSAWLSPHKSVMTRSEIEQVITQMGPVDAEPVAGASAGAAASAGARSGPAGGPAASDAGDATAAPRRLYQISEGAMVSGICNGYAAYSGIDVTWIRVIFVLLILLTGGGALIAYLVFMFIIPYANTSEEHAAARGLPFNARLLVENAKRHYTQFASSHEWRRERESWRKEWRHTRAQWRLERRRAREEWRQHRRYGRPFAGYAPPPPGTATAPTASAPYFAHVLSGSLMALLGLMLAAVGLVMVVTIFSLINTNAIFGWPLPEGIPLWAAILGLVLIWNFVALPIRAIRHSAYWYGGNYNGPWFAAFDGIVTCAIVIGLMWWGVHHIGQIHEFFQNLPRLWHNDSWSNTAADTSAKIVVRFCTTLKHWLLVSPKA